MKKFKSTHVWYKSTLTHLDYLSQVWAKCPIKFIEGQDCHDRDRGYYYAQKMLHLELGLFSNGMSYSFSDSISEEQLHMIHRTLLNCVMQPNWTILHTTIASLQMGISGCASLTGMGYSSNRTDLFFKDPTMFVADSLAEAKLKSAMHGEIPLFADKYLTKVHAETALFFIDSMDDFRSSITLPNDCTGPGVIQCRVQAKRCICGLTFKCVNDHVRRNVDDS